MRHILSDWYNEEMHAMRRQEALEKLVTTFNHDNIRLFPLAKQVKQVLGRTN